MHLPDLGLAVFVTIFYFVLFCFVFVLGVLCLPPALPPCTQCHPTSPNIIQSTLLPEMNQNKSSQQRFPKCLVSERTGWYLGQPSARFAPVCRLEDSPLWPLAALGPAVITASTQDLRHGEARLGQPEVDRRLSTMHWSTSSGVLGGCACSR